MTDFFKIIHANYYPDQDISFMEYFLEIIKKDKEFCIEHTKLVKYGVLSSNQSSDIRRKLDRHFLKKM